MSDGRAKAAINRSQSFSLAEKRTLREMIENATDYAGWRDLTMPATSAVLGPTAPGLVGFGPDTTTRQYQFDPGESLDFVAHVDHDWLRGSLAYFHVHWAIGSTETNPVTWHVHYTVAKGHQQEAFGNASEIILTQSPTGTAWQHMIVEDTVGIDLRETDSLVLFNITLETNGNTAKPFLLTCDLHYQVGQIATPNRAPDFFKV